MLLKEAQTLGVELTQGVTVAGQISMVQAKITEAKAALIAYDKAKTLVMAADAPPQESGLKQSDKDDNLARLASYKQALEHLKEAERLGHPNAARLLPQLKSRISFGEAMKLIHEAKGIQNKGKLVPTSKLWST